MPSVNAPRQRSSALRASVERSGRRGRLALTAWSARLEGAPVFTAQDAGAAGAPAGYLGAVDTFASSSFVCGSPAIGSLAFTSFQPANQLSRGVTAAGTLEIGKALVAGFASVQSRFVTDATPATAALSPAGTQVPGTPLHRAGLVATAKLGKSVDVLANVGYTAANNPNRLPAYTVFNAGFAAPLREGSIAIVGTNLGNTHPGPFVTGADAFALPRIGAPPLALAATPLAPRAVTLTYTVRAGRLGSTGSGAATTDASAPGEDDHGGVEIRIRATPMREGAHPNALQIDPDNDACTPAAAKLAQPVMDAMGRIAASAERAKSNGRYAVTLRDGTAVVSGVTLAYTPYEDGARFVIVATSNMQAGAALVNCARLSVAQPGDNEKFHVYVPATTNGFFIAYSPSVGIYLVPPAQAGARRDARARVRRSRAGGAARRSVRAARFARVSGRLEARRRRDRRSGACGARSAARRHAAPRPRRSRRSSRAAPQPRAGWKSNPPTRGRKARWRSACTSRACRARTCRAPASPTRGVRARSASATGSGST